MWRRHRELMGTTAFGVEDSDTSYDEDDITSNSHRCNSGSGNGNKNHHQRRKDKKNTASRNDEEAPKINEVELCVGLERQFCEKTRKLLLCRYTIKEIDTEIWNEVLFPSSVVSATTEAAMVVRPNNTKAKTSSNKECRYGLQRVGGTRYHLPSGSEHSGLSSCSATTTSSSAVSTTSSEILKGSRRGSIRRPAGNKASKQSHLHYPEQQQRKEFIQIFVQLPMLPERRSSTSSKSRNHLPGTVGTWSRLTPLCVPANCTVKHLKMLVQDRCDESGTSRDCSTGDGHCPLLPASRQRLFFGGTSQLQHELEDPHVLSYYGIDCEHTILCRYDSEGSNKSKIN